jgi:uncharacterized RDD family membrane protein YckC
MRVGVDPPRHRSSAREIITPEGIPLNLTMADTGDRAAAFAFDMLLITAAVMGVYVLAVLATGAELENSWMGAFVLVVAFLLRNFYFTFFEIRWQGSTPGKRILELRVIDRRGGALLADSVIARNLVRDVEVFLPLQALVAPEQLLPNAKGLAVVLASLWVIALMLLPMFNCDRLRVGDLVAGTLVVQSPKAMLLPDLGAGVATVPDARYRFTPQQLAVYGIYELQVLEDVLRRSPATTEQTLAEAMVCERIKTKIEWNREHWDVAPDRFLREFYTALRSRLEQDLLLGKRKEDQYADRVRPPSD